MTASLPFGQVRPETPQDWARYIERLQNGSLPFRKLLLEGPLSWPVRAVLAATTVDDVDATITLDATAGAFTVMLPDATTRPGQFLWFIKLQAANTVTIDAFGAQTINGALTIALTAAFSVAILQSDGSGWLRFL